MILADYIMARLDTPFEWGTHDCVLFAANWLRLSTGIDHLDGIKPWHTAKQAAMAIKKAGGLEAALDERLQRIGINYAADGDLALYKGSVCLFSGAYIFGPGEQCLTRNSRMLAEAAWRATRERERE